MTDDEMTEDEIKTLFLKCSKEIADVLTSNQIPIDMGVIILKTLARHVEKKTGLIICTEYKTIDELAVD